MLPGADAFRLYDTYGFPLDLTEDILSDAGMTADTEGFDKLMTEQRERARAARGDISGWTGLDLGLEGVPTAFTGYDTLEDTATVEALIADGELAGELGEGAEGSVVLDRTPFYAEMGGQVADHGTISTADGALFAVTDVQKTKGGKYLHTGKMERGSLRLGDDVTACVDAERRRAIMRAHSATHLLHAALRKVLGDHVHQAGCLVEPDRLRFDFTHFSAMTGEELLEVARLVNHEILAGDGISTEEMSLDEARAQGAQALFGEKYGESVRVVTMGGFSSELCGGTHMDNTAKVGPFRIESEFSVASGVRRIEAVTGLEFFRENEENNRKLLEMADMLKTCPARSWRRPAPPWTACASCAAAWTRCRTSSAPARSTTSSPPPTPWATCAWSPPPSRRAATDDMRRMGDFLRDRAAEHRRRAGQRARGQDNLPRRLRQGGRRRRREGRRHHPPGHGHHRRQGRRQARQRHGRRQGRAHARQRPRHGRQLRGHEAGPEQGIRRKR